jgi:hypothetical protein
MCTIYENNYLRCQPESGLKCRDTEYVPCNSGLCKGDAHLHVMRWKEGKCLEHRTDEEEEKLVKTKFRYRKGSMRKEWPETDCRPM